MALLAAFNLRLPRDLRETLERLARENQRSLNAEIIYRLRQAVEGYRR
jgi:predicted HicB family RNase H-like nuclease